MRGLMRHLSLIVCGSLLGVTGGEATAQTSTLQTKVNAYIGCTNRLSARAYDARERYFSWAAKSGPTGRERIIYGTYQIYDTNDCQAKVAQVNQLEPRHGTLEAAATDYVNAVTTLGPLLKEADDYYTQNDYKDDKMAKGRALHPRLVAAWTHFETADAKLRSETDVVLDKLELEEIAAIERTEGQHARFHIKALMYDAKKLARAQGDTTANLGRVTELLAKCEASLKSAESYAASDKDRAIGSSFLSSARTFITTSKQLMRRVRDKVPYSQGEQMLQRAGGAGWMVEGSPARLTRDYNSLVDSYNRGAKF